MTDEPEGTVLPYAFCSVPGYMNEDKPDGYNASDTSPARPIPELTEKWGKVADVVLEMLAEVRQSVWWKMATKRKE